MINIKSNQEIEVIRQGGRKLRSILDKLIVFSKPGLKTREIDNLAEKLIKDQGGFPSFKMVPRYHYATCLCIDSAVVHGIPSDYVLKNGDMLSIDIGIFYKGFHTDMAESFIVGGKESQTVKKFLDTGEKALQLAIGQAVEGKRIGHISEMIEETVKKGGYSVVKELIGHGVGKQLHEEPAIPGILKTDIANTPILKKGMVLAIEIIYNLGLPGIVYSDDGWTIKTKDGNLSGLFEKTVVVGQDKAEILT